jgi:hypothetical protein
MSPVTLRLDPRRTAARSDKEEPNIIASKIDALEPNLPQERTDNAEDMMVDPTTETVRQLPNMVKPATLMLLPNLAKDRRLRELPPRTCCNTLIDPPILRLHLALRLEPKCTDPTMEVSIPTLHPPSNETPDPTLVNALNEQLLPRDA